MFIKQLLFLLISTFLTFNNLTAQTEFSELAKQKKIYPMGEKIYQKLCNQNIDFEKYSNIDELTNSIKNENLCKPMKENHFQAVVLYLWDVQRISTARKLPEHIKVTKDEKCPVCGMFVYKYPRWAAQIFYKDTKDEHHYSFDGVKDLMKYYFDNKENISKILVSDYYSQKVIEAQQAYFVIGSDTYGPMGDELIPFESESEAKTFYMDHRASKIVKFQDITKEDVYKLDE